MNTAMTIINLLCLLGSFAAWWLIRARLRQHTSAMRCYVEYIKHLTAVLDRDGDA